MRARTSGENDVLAARHSAKFLKVEIQDADGDWIDYSDYIDTDRLDRVEVARDSSRIARFTLELAREIVDSAGDVVSLSPLINSDIALGRGVRISGARVAIGSAPGVDDWKLRCEGKIDRWDAAQDPMVLSGRDLAGMLADRKVEAETEYGTEAGVPVEELIQTIIDDWADGAFTLLLDADSPLNDTPFVIFPYKIDEGTSVWDAITALAEKAGGHVIEYRWNDDAVGYVLTLLRPDRAVTVPQWTFGPDDYYDVTRLDAELTNVRNAWELSYRDAGTGSRETVTSEDTDSITDYGRLWAKITEADDSPIDTEDEAQAMLDAARADTSRPDADHEVEVDLWWPGELGDYYRHSPNVVHYLANQDFAVQELKDVWEKGTALTHILTRGKPAGRPFSWRRQSRQIPAIEEFAVDGVPVLDEDNGVWNLFTNRTRQAGAVYYTITHDGSAPADPLGASEAGGPVGTLSTLSTIPNVRTSTVDGENVRVKMVAVENADGTGDVGPIREARGTFHAANNRPTISWLRFQPADLTKEGVRFSARDDGPTVNFGYAVAAAGAGAPSWPSGFTLTGLVSDPVNVEVAVAKPAEGAADQLIYYQAVDADGNLAYTKPQIVRIDGNEEPSGWIDPLDASPGVTPKVVVNTDDSDTGSWRFRVNKVTSESDDTFVAPAFTDANANEFHGNSFGAVTLLDATHQLVEGQRLNIVAYFFRTTSATAANQAASIRSPLVKLVVRLGASRVPTLVIETEDEVHLDYPEDDLATPPEITFVGAAGAVGDAVDISAIDIEADDLAIVFAFQEGTTNTPSLPTGWTSFDTGADSLARYRIGYKLLTGGETDIGVWTNSEWTEVVILRGAGGLGAKGVHQTGNGDGLVVIPGISALSVVDGSSWVVGFYGHNFCSNANTRTVPGMTTRGGTTDTWMGTAENVSAWAEANGNNVNGAGRWQSQAVEVTAAVPSISGDLGKVVVRLSDPAGLATQIQVRKRTSPALFPDQWLTLLESPPAGVQSDYPIYVALVEKRLGFIQARLVYEIGGETFYSDPITSSGMDLGQIPDLSVRTEFIGSQKIGAAFWYAAPGVQGDVDTKSFAVGWEKGISPAPPSESEVEAGLGRADEVSPTPRFVNQRTAEPMDLAAILSGVGLPVPLAPGEQARFGVIGFGEVDGGGLRSTDYYVVAIRRPTEEPAAVEFDPDTPATLDVSESGDDLIYDTTFAVLGADGTHNVEVTVYAVGGGVDPATDTAVDTDGVLGLTAPDAAAAGATFFRAEFTLYDVDGVTPLDTTVAFFDLGGGE